MYHTESPRYFADPLKNIFVSFIISDRLFAQFKDRHPDERQKQYEACGRPGTKADAEELGFRFELADWAYILDKDALAANLTEHGYKLLRHDITALPGYLGHYIALHSGSKKCVIGVKGTSNLEDMLTDCCGLGVEETLQDGTKIYCHEGIYISAKRLADDIEEFVRDLILPAGYHLELVGHSVSFLLTKERSNDSFALALMMMNTWRHDWSNGFHFVSSFGPLSWVPAVRLYWP